MELLKTIRRSYEDNKLQKKTISPKSEKITKSYQTFTGDDVELTKECFWSL